MIVARALPSTKAVAFGLINCDPFINLKYKIENDIIIEII